MKKIIKENGGMVEREEDMLAAVTDYFGSLFSWCAGQRVEELLEHVQARVTPQMNERMMAEFTSEEIKAALDGIGDLKAPGPDGLPAIFFKRYWHLVGEQVTKEVLHILNGGEFPDDWNNTCVTLIPKVKNPEKMKDLRPISL
jgi:hypothetical protein